MISLPNSGGLQNYRQVARLLEEPPRHRKICRASIVSLLRNSARHEATRGASDDGARYRSTVITRRPMQAKAICSGERDTMAPRISPSLRWHTAAAAASASDPDNMGNCPRFVEVKPRCAERSTRASTAPYCNYASGCGSHEGRRFERGRSLAR